MTEKQKTCVGFMTENVKYNEPKVTVDIDYLFPAYPQTYVFEHYIPKEEHDKLKEDLKRVEKELNLIKDIYEIPKHVHLSCLKDNYISEETVRDMFEALIIFAEILHKKCPNEHNRDDYYWGWNDSAIEFQKELDKSKKQILGEKT